MRVWRCEWGQSGLGKKEVWSDQRTCQTAHGGVRGAAVGKVGVARHAKEFRLYSDF